MKSFLTIMLFLFSGLLYGQNEYQYFYRIYLNDKGGEQYLAETILSDRAIQRRQKAGIDYPDFIDFPVYLPYIEQITKSGFTLHSTSKWMNTVLVKTRTFIDPSVLLGLQFVSDVKIVKSPGSKKNLYDKLAFEVLKQDYPPFDRPVTMVNGYPLHDAGFDGRNILIAVLDGGFANADDINSLEALHNRNGIKSTYDFVRRNDFVFDYSFHGTAVMSVLAGNLTGYIAGTAPGADYILLLTEDVSSEFPCEEDFWAAGAEYADSAGADILSSSLGYFTFDDPSMNYKISDLDGNTAFVTRAADIAASKGIIVINSAGNERNNEWQKIIFPSDGDSVLAAGAVDGNNIVASFSSAGPSADERIKPDNVALGVYIPVQTERGYTGRSNGTSFSCPVLSGMAACLLQAVPEATVSEVIEAMHSSADRFNNPDSLYGYGIPDMTMALNNLQDMHLPIPDAESVAGPNPTTGDVEIIFHENPRKLIIEIVTISGKVIYRKNFTNYAGRILRITELQNREQGVYFIRLIKESGTNVHKIIKLQN